jgi:hypothetical protein
MLVPRAHSGMECIFEPSKSHRKKQFLDQFLDQSYNKQASSSSSFSPFTFRFLARASVEAPRAQIRIYGSSTKPRPNCIKAANFIFLQLSIYHPHPESSQGSRGLCLAHPSSAFITTPSFSLSLYGQRSRNLTKL